MNIFVILWNPEVIAAVEDMDLLDDGKEKEGEKKTLDEEERKKKVEEEQERLAEAEKKQIIEEKKRLLQEKQKKRLEELKKNKQQGKSTALSNSLLDENYVKKAFKKQLNEFMNLRGRLTTTTATTPPKRTPPVPPIDLSRARKSKMAREKETAAEAEELCRQEPGTKKHILEDDVEGEDIYVDEDRASVYQGEGPFYFTAEEEAAANAGIEDPEDSL
jgi:hypothetical protein